MKTKKRCNVIISNRKCKRYALINNKCKQHNKIQQLLDSKCFICGNDCNPCSQTCGHCARKLTAISLGWYN